MKYLFTSLATILILVAVLLPGSNLPDVNVVGIDKAAHVTLFTLWIVAVRYDFAHRFKWSWAIIAGLTFSVLTEVLQIAVEGRTFDWTDIVADTAGLAFGLLAGGMIVSWISRIGTGRKR